MTDADLVAKKLAEVETYLHELRTLARLDRLESDLREQRFICHTLQLAVQVENRLGDLEAFVAAVRSRAG